VGQPNSIPGIRFWEGSVHWFGGLTVRFATFLFSVFLFFLFSFFFYSSIESFLNYEHFHIMNLNIFRFEHFLDLNNFLT
jgi:hypothetical protein